MLWLRHQVASSPDSNFSVCLPFLHCLTDPARSIPRAVQGCSTLTHLPSTHATIHLPTQLFICLSIHVPMDPSSLPSIHLSILPSIYLIRPSISIYVLTCPSTTLSFIHLPIYSLIHPLSMQSHVRLLTHSSIIHLSNICTYIHTCAQVFIHSPTHSSTYPFIDHPFIMHALIFSSTHAFICLS